jgi:leucyl/phenylalanyl-tRNA---protein transferase
MRRRTRPPLLLPSAPPTALPPADEALDNPAGLLAIGGSLGIDWLRHAYLNGIFPWYSPGDPILWWSPDPRMVFRPEALRVPRSLRKSVRNRGYIVGFDNFFNDVVRACAGRGQALGSDHQPPDSIESSSPDTSGSRLPDNTWIVPEMAAAYAALHAAGDAHSVEVWQEGKLVGGLYGVSLGGMFWGESMFTRARDASKVALLALAAECRRRGIGLIDAQFHTPHLASLGGMEMGRTEFLGEVARRTAGAAQGQSWQRAASPLDLRSLQDDGD